MGPYECWNRVVWVDCWTLQSLVSSLLEIYNRRFESAEFHIQVRNGHFSKGECTERKTLLIPKNENNFCFSFLQLRET